MARFYIILNSGSRPFNKKIIFISVTGGYVELQWELGGGVGTIQNTRVPVSDNTRHTVVVKRTAHEATLEVDGKEDHGKAPGLTRVLNADSSIYVGQYILLLLYFSKPVLKNDIIYFTFLDVWTLMHVHAHFSQKSMDIHLRQTSSVPLCCKYPSYCQL